ncbi:MAG: glutamyl-tRNA reductase [Ignavibacteriaceae bacterium]|nr:glutamyl-tRNA reductase [Ignavibacteriaceae bacterium]
MHLIAVTINHHTAPVELRETLHLSSEEIAVFVKKAKGNLFKEGLIISTCNRTEVYGIPVDPKIDYHEIQKFLINEKSVLNINADNFRNYLSTTAVKHLFSVITGIDSLLIGDNQIYHQVKDSFQLAEELNFTGYLTKKLFDAAIKTGKRAITETEISEGAVTVSYAAVQLIEKIFSSLNKKSALVIGAGETGEIAAKHLKERGIGKLSITNRTVERAEKIAEKLNAHILPFETFKNSVHEYDIILSATSSPGFILTKDDIKAAMKRRNFSPTILMDIAIPRDIDPKAGDIDSVFYHDIDSLNIIVGQNLNKRRDEIPKVEKIIDEEVANFFSWYNSLEVAPTIKSLREHFENIRAEEVEKNINRFSDDDKEKLEIITKRIVNKLLHQPTVELKKMSEQGQNSDEAAAKISILKGIFGINNTEKEG